MTTELQYLLSEPPEPEPAHQPAPNRPSRKKTAQRQSSRGRRPLRPLTVTGVLSELLLTAGILLGLFIAWQVWWTDVIAGADQDQAVEAFTASDTYVPPVQAPADDGDKETGQAPEAAVPSVPASAFATMRVPRWGSDYVMPVAQGVGLDVINRIGLGHYTSTAELGQEGNFALAGHRTTYGRPLHNVHTLREGDDLIFETDDTWYVYRVIGHQIVQPTQNEVLGPVPPIAGASEGGRYVTLTTCHPLWGMSERYIVYGELDYWLDKADGTPDQVIEN
ncbi:class E sortase [Pseudactinotalea sp. HY160]|uniref:class E sortase n=1 Tax=Pseudactinotalea sp. HY160 TaxID=2654490 RepID=UPI001883C74F